MRIPRPHIPLSVRVAVAERQLWEMARKSWWIEYLAHDDRPAGVKLKECIEKLSEILGDVLQLDHDPALILRQYKVDRRKPKAAWFTPNANDPDHLIYRVIGDHGQKTTGRKPGATKTITTKGSDVWLKTKFARLERKQKINTSDIPETTKSWFKKAKVKIPSRPLGKGRPFPRRAPRASR